MSRIAVAHYNAGKLVVKGSGSYAIPVAELTDCTASVDAEDKTLPNEDQVPVLSIRSALKVSIKAKVQRVLSMALHAAMTGGTVTAGAAKVVIENESHAAGVSVTVDNGATFSEDLGVKDANGNPMEPIAAAPTVGQYVPGAVGVGTYTFNVAETGNVRIDYVKTSTTGETVTVDNQAQAESPTLTGWFYGSSKQPDGTTKKTARYFYKLVPSKLSEAQKRGDFADSDIELTAIANAAGKFYEVHRS